MLRAFYEGCPVEKKLIENFAYEPSKIAVIFGVYKSKVKKSWPRGKVFQQQREKNLDVVVLETGYINRGDGENHHYAAGFNGLNGRADFRNKNMGPERFEMLKTGLRPYSNGDNIILCGQVPHDASVDHTDHKKWILETALELKRRTKRPVIFRPHPLFPLPRIGGCGYSLVPLEDDFANAHAVVTFNSNTAVDALLWGKAVYAFDEGSMVWNVCNKDLATINAPEYHNRLQWSRDLAYCQWTLDEMRQGKTWSHLYR